MDCIGYFVILLSILGDIKLQKWYKNRSSIKPYEIQIEKQKMSQKPDKEKATKAIIQEMKALKSHKSLIVQSYHNLQAAKYFTEGIKGLVEDLLIFLILLACISKRNIFILAYLIYLLILLALKRSSNLNTTIHLASLFYVLYIIQYIFLLAYMSPESTPQKTPISTDTSYLLSKYSIKLQFIKQHIEAHYTNPYNWIHYAGFSGSKDHPTSTLYYLLFEAFTYAIFYIYFEKYFNYTCTESMKYKAVGTTRHQSYTCIGRIIHVVFLYGHIFTLLIVMIMVTMTNGTQCILYCVFCFVYFLSNPDFVMNKEWAFPYYLRVILLNALYIDITLQMVYQSPLNIFNFTNFKNNEEWQNVICYICYLLGLNKLETSNKSMINMIFIIICFFIASMQLKLLRSSNFKEYIKQHHLEYSKNSRYKAELSTKLFNNKRVFNYLLDKYNISTCSKLLIDLNSTLSKWNINMVNSQEEMPNKVLPSHIHTKGWKIVKDHAEYSQATNNASIMEKIYFFLNSFIDPILFANPNNIKDIASKIEDGVRKIRCPLEENYIQIYNVNKKIAKLQEKKKTATPEEIIAIDSKISEYNNKIKANNDNIKKQAICTKLFCKCITSINKIIFSNTAIIAYVFMILAMIMNGNLLSLFYPLSIFGFGIIELSNPNKKFWNCVMIYAESILGMKIFIQLPIWKLILNGMTKPDIIKAMIEIFQDSYRIGLIMFENSMSLSFLNYILWDCLIILTIIVHQSVLINSGLYNYREEEIEPIVGNNSAQMRLNSIISQKKKNDDIDPNSQSNSSIVIVSGTEETGSFNYKRIIDVVFFKAKYMRKLFPMLKNEKPGKDLYKYCIAFQLALCLYILLFCTRMSADVSDISETIDFNTFSNETVIILIIQTFIIVIDRILYLEHSDTNFNENNKDKASRDTEFRGIIQTEYRKTNNYMLFFKYALNWGLLISVHLLTFWLFPNQGNKKLCGNTICTYIGSDKQSSSASSNEVLSKPSIVIFYLLYIGYFFSASYQIKYGWPELKISWYMRRDPGLINSITTKLYRAIPFGMELNVFANYSFTKTSLDLFQWLKLDSLYTRVFLAKCYYNGYENRKLGNLMSKPRKFFEGFCAFFGMIILLIIPLLLFSGLNPIAQSNPVKSIDVSFGINYDINYFNLFQTTHIYKIVQGDNITNSSNISQIFENYYQVELSNVQELSILSYSDSMWNPTPQTKEKLAQYLNPDNSVKQLTFSLNIRFLRDVQC